MLIFFPQKAYDFQYKQLNQHIILKGEKFIFLQTLNIYLNLVCTYRNSSKITKNRV